MQIAVVIPAYNETATIADIVHRARRRIERVIVVDDGSRDDTAARAEASGAVVLRQRLSKNSSLIFLKNFS